MSNYEVQPDPTTTMHLMTTNEVAALLRTSPATVRYWRHIGTGPAGFKLGRRVLYDARAVQRWLERKQAEESGLGRRERLGA